MSSQKKIAVKKVVAKKVAAKKVVAKAKPVPVKHPLEVALNAEESKRGRFLTTAEVMKVYHKTLPKMRDNLKGLGKLKLKGSRTTEATANAPAGEPVVTVEGSDVTIMLPFDPPVDQNSGG